MVRIGIDLGGTKIEAIALGESGAALWRRRVATPAGDYAAILQTIQQLITQLETELGRRGSIGIGTPGALSPATGRIKNANSVCLNGRPLLQDLQQCLDRPVRLANDADCFALSEAVDGAGAGTAVVFGVIIGTGTGGGIVVNGRLLSGPNAIAGEWGHNPLPWPQPQELPGPECYCGKHGCIETWLSGPGLECSYRQQAGVSRPVPEILQAAQQGDRRAQDVLESYVDRMARGLASVINLLDPGVIVLGGGLSRLDFLYRRVPEQWARYVFSDRVDTRLLPARHGDSSGVRGAAWLWPAHHADS